MMYREIEECRGCGETFFLDTGGLQVFDLGEQWLATHFVGPWDLPTLDRFPLRLLECQSCKLVQLSGTVDRKLLFTNYWYRSSISNTMRSHLQQLAQEASVVADLKPGDIVMDIGANDGTLLSYFSDGVTKVAYEPSNLADLIPNDVLLYKGFFPTDILSKKAKLIMAIAMFYDLEEPLGFLQAVRNQLHDDGVFCVEVFDWPALMRMGAFDTICHEHLLYFSFSTLVEMAKKVGLYLRDFSFSSINGASMRLYLSPEDRGCFYNREEDLHWGQFTADATLNCRELHRWLLTEQALGRSGVALGASTKGNVFLQAAELHRGLIDAIEDRDPRKEGLKTLGTGIPIVGEKPWDLRKHDVYWKLILPWHFLPEIVERERLFLKEGGVLLAAIPNFRTIMEENWEEEVRVFQEEIRSSFHRLEEKATSDSSSTTGS